MGLRKPFTVVSILLLNISAWASVSVFGPLILDITQSFSLQIGIIGVVHSVFLIVSGISSFLWAFLESQYSPKKLLIYTLLMYSGALILTSFSVNLIAFVIFRAIAAIGFGAVLPLASSLILDLYSSETKTKSLALLGTSTFIGFGAGNVIAGFLLGGTSWQAILFILSMTCLISIVLFAFSRLPNRGSSMLSGEDHANEFHFRRTKISAIAKTHSNIFLILFFFIYDFVIGTVSFYLVPLLRTDFSFTPFTSMIIQTLTYLPLLVGIPYWGKKADIKSLNAPGGKIKLLLLTVSIGPVASIVAYSLGTVHIGIFITGLMVFTFITSSATSIAYSILGDINLPELHPTVFSFGNLSAIVGRSLGIALCGILYNTISLNYSFIFLMWQVIFLIGLPLTLLIPRRRVALEMEKVRRLIERNRQKENLISDHHATRQPRKIETIMDAILDSQMKTMSTLRKLAKNQYFLSKMMYYTLEVVKRTIHRIDKLENDNDNILSVEGQDGDSYFKTIEELKAHLE
ncbi:MAG: MFS transporter [Promethearchaeota archaeon]|jgi:MFS family permease